MELEHQIRIARERLGLDQMQLAQKMGVSKTAVANWEEGSVPHKGRLMQLQQMLGVMLYVTGTPGRSGKGEYDFSAEDVGLLFAVHKLSVAQRDAIERIIYSMANTATRKRSGEFSSTQEPVSRVKGNSNAKSGTRKDASR